MITESKLPEITFFFWILKICATTLGETGADLLSMTLNIGYAVSSIIFLAFFIITLIAQLFSKKYYPSIYWLVLLGASTVGTTISDFMNRTMGIGYTNGSLILSTLLILTLIIWKISEKSLSVTNVNSKRGEKFYWLAILLSNTLGTSLGDFLADNSGLGFSGAAILIGSSLIILFLLYLFTEISRISLFWMAFVLSRPFGATFGDYLSKPFEKGGLNFGTINSSVILFCAFLFLIIIASLKANKVKEAGAF